MLSKGKTAEAEKIVRKAATVNQVKIPESVFQDEPLETKDEEQVSAISTILSFVLSLD